MNVSTLANGSASARPQIRLSRSGCQATRHCRERAARSTRFWVPTQTDWSIRRVSEFRLSLSAVRIPAARYRTRRTGISRSSLSRFRNTVVEVAYVGNASHHLYLPLININPRNVGIIDQLESSGLCPTCAPQDATGTIADPLGRTNLQGAVISITRASVFTTYLGFDPLNSTSIRPEIRFVMPGTFLCIVASRAG